MGKLVALDWEDDCMTCDPFEGDFGGAGANDGVLSDKMVWCRKSCECHTCAGEVEISMRIRRRAEVYDGEFMRFAWCQTCCEAMAKAAEDPDAYEALIELGRERRALSREAGHGG